LDDFKLAASGGNNAVRARKACAASHAGIRHEDTAWVGFVGDISTRRRDDEGPDEQRREAACRECFSEYDNPSTADRHSFIRDP